MKPIDTLIEVLDDTHVRVYRADKVHMVADAELSKVIGKCALLTDPAHVFHARLPMALQKKQLNSVVLASLVEDDLTAPNDSFAFSGNVHRGKTQYTDVAWLSKARLHTLKTRFSNIHSALAGIAPASLLMTANKPVRQGVTIMHHSPWHYVIKKKEDKVETLSVSDALLPIWQTSLSNSHDPLHETDFCDASHIFNSPVPIIAFSSVSEQTKTSWGKVWFWSIGLLTLIMILWSINEYLALRIDKAQLKQLKNAQVGILTQIFPNTTNISDPYGRLQSEIAALSGMTLLRQINQVLAGATNSELSKVQANLSAQEVTLTFTDSDSAEHVKTSLVDAGLTVMQDEEKLIITSNSAYGSGE